MVQTSEMLITEQFWQSEKITLEQLLIVNNVTQNS